jgi:hypothetical protein
MELNRKYKLLLITILLLLISINPGAMENSFVLVDKLVPNNIRLTNNISSGEEFFMAEKTVAAFLKRWTIAGASIAIAKDGKLPEVLVMPTLHLKLKLSHTVNSGLQAFRNWSQP